MNTAGIKGSAGDVCFMAIITDCAFSRWYEHPLSIRVMAACVPTRSRKKALNSFERKEARVRDIPSLCSLEMRVVAYSLGRVRVQYVTRHLVGVCVHSHEHARIRWDGSASQTVSSRILLATPTHPPPTHIRRNSCASDMGLFLSGF